MAKPPLFLRPANYRRRRKYDLARILPIAGGFLFLLPILWSPIPGQETGRSTASDTIYIFIVWALLVLGAGLIAHSLTGDEALEDHDPEQDRDYGG